MPWVEFIARPSFLPAHLRFYSRLHSAAIPALPDFHLALILRLQLFSAKLLHSLLLLALWVKKFLQLHAAARRFSITVRLQAALTLSTRLCLLLLEHSLCSQAALLAPLRK